MIAQRPLSAASAPRRWSPAMAARSRKRYLSSCAAPAGQCRPLSRAASRSTAAHSACSASNPLLFHWKPVIRLRSAAICRTSSRLREKHAWRPRPWPSSAQLTPGVMVVDIGVAQRLLKMPDQVSRLLVGKSKGPRAELESVAGNKLRLVEPDAETDLERLTDSFHLNLTAFGLLSFFVGLFIVNSAIGLAFEQRLPML